ARRDGVRDADRPDGVEHIYSVVGATNLTYPFDYLGAGTDAVNGSALTQNNATTVTLTERNGTKVIWASPDGGTTWRISQVVQPGGPTPRYYVAASSRIATTVPPAPAGVTCESAAPATPGCRSLTIDYATTTTATGTAPSQWGSYAGTINDIVY